MESTVNEDGAMVDRRNGSSLVGIVTTIVPPERHVTLEITVGGKHGVFWALEIEWPWRDTATIAFGDADAIDLAHCHTGRDKLCVLEPDVSVGVEPARLTLRLADSIPEQEVRFDLRLWFEPRRADVGHTDPWPGLYGTRTAIDSAVNRVTATPYPPVEMFKMPRAEDLR